MGERRSRELVDGAGRGVAGEVGGDLGVTGDSVVSLGRNWLVGLMGEGVLIVGLPVFFTVDAGEALETRMRLKFARSFCAG